MFGFSQEEKCLSTERGPVRIRNFCTPEEIRRFQFNPQFGTHAHYRSLYTHRESLEKYAEKSGANVTLALNDDNAIVGFAVLGDPDPEERWAGLDSLLMEVKAVEVARDWRRIHLSAEILEMLLRHPELEEKIIYMVGYSWTWDLDGTSRTAQQYRQMLIRLFERFDFVEYQTNEPNICLKPENIFMGRVGRQVSEADQKRFKWLRFGMEP